MLELATVISVTKHKILVLCASRVSTKSKKKKRNSAYKYALGRRKLLPLKGLMAPSTLQLTAQLETRVPPPKVCRTICCSGLWCKDQVLLLKTLSASQISG